MLIDSHCHLDFDAFDPDRDEVIARARAAGVVRIVNVGSSLAGSRRSCELAEKQDIVYASVGIHPHEASHATDEAVAELKALAGSRKVVAIGEIGLDYYRNLAPKDVQIAAFKRLLGLARELELPVILHARDTDRDLHDANRDLLAILKGEMGPTVRGVMHCFSADEAMLRECLALGLHISFTCNITFKNKSVETLRQVARRTPVERLLLETDAPYLAPQALRGERNEPANVSVLADEFSKLLGLTREDVCRITTHNANGLFALGLDAEAAKIAYEIRDSLYLNITNRCTNACDFCVRSQTSFVKGHNLRLDREPSAGEILEAIKDPAKYREIVFCGYGEPTMRLETVKEVASAMKRAGARVRMVTNGHGDLINGRPIAAELAGLIDRVSVSLNTDQESSYRAVCKPEFGERSYGQVIGFIKECVRNGITVEATCLDLPGVDVKRCEEMARSFGATFRLRHLGVVG